MKKSITLYLDMVEHVDEAKTIDESLNALKRVETKFSCRSRHDLIMLKSDISTIIERNRQWAVLGIITSLLIFTLPIYFNTLKDMLLEITRDLMLLNSNDMVNKLIEDKSSSWTNFIIAVLTMLVVLLIVNTILKILKNIQGLSLLEKIIDQIIAERDKWDEAHVFAYSEYIIFLKNKENKKNQLEAWL